MHNTNEKAQVSGMQLDPESGEMFFEDWVELQDEMRKGAGKPAPVFETDAPCREFSMTYCHAECDESCDGAYRDYLVRHWASNPDPREPMDFFEWSKTIARACVDCT